MMMERAGGSSFECSPVLACVAALAWWRLFRGCYEVRCQMTPRKMDGARYDVVLRICVRHCVALIRKFKMLAASGRCAGKHSGALLENRTAWKVQASFCSKHAVISAGKFLKLWCSLWQGVRFAA